MFLGRQRLRGEYAHEIDVFLPLFHGKHVKLVPVYVHHVELFQTLKMALAPLIPDLTEFCD